ncbi:MAG: hypothetical protein ACOYOO_08415 [Saprospiraceae bacterium]
MATKKDDNVSEKPELDFKKVWEQFCRDLRFLLVTRKNNRMLDQFLDLKNRVLDRVEGEEFKTSLVNAYNNLNKEDPPKEVRESLLLEIASFSRAKEIAVSVGDTSNKKRWWKKWGNWLLGKASVVTGSVKDIVGDNSNLKSTLILLGEVIDIFKGDK